MNLKGIIKQMTEAGSSVCLTGNGVDMFACFNLLCERLEQKFPDHKVISVRDKTNKKGLFWASTEESYECCAPVHSTAQRTV